MVKKAQNIRKSPKNKIFKGTYYIPPFWEHPVYREAMCILNLIATFVNLTLFLPHYVSCKHMSEGKVTFI